MNPEQLVAMSMKDQTLRRFLTKKIKILLSAGFSELLAELVEAAVAHCQLIVVSK